MNEEIFKPFYVSRTFTVNNVHPDAPRDDCSDFIALNKSRTIGAQRILGIIAICEVQPPIKADKSSERNNGTETVCSLVMAGKGSAYWQRIHTDRLSCDLAQFEL